MDARELPRTFVDILENPKPKMHVSNENSESILTDGTITILSLSTLCEKIKHYITSTHLNPIAYTMSMVTKRSESNLEVRT